MKVRLTLAAALSLFAAPTLAQRAMIAPGMTPAQVRDVFGAPARTRAEGPWSYWFYANGCPIRCGSDDVVFFRNDSVVAAVLRSRGRMISGPRAPDALEHAGGDIDADAIRAQAGEAPPVAAERAPRRRQGRIIVRGRSHPADEAPGQPPARVGRIHVESGGRTIDRATTPSDDRDAGAAPPPRTTVGQPQGPGRTTIIRRGATPGGRTPTSGAIRDVGDSTPVLRRGDANGVSPTSGGVITAGAQSPQGPLTDTTGTGRATSVDDKRYTRESQVTRTTVPNQPDTIQAKRRDRENNVTPRVVPQP
jgi:hypothetical protein